MADWHLDELRWALEGRGWRVVAEHPGDGVRVSATWEIERSSRRPALFIDFDGLDDLHVLPLSKSYGCRVRNAAGAGLYFRRRRNRSRWKEELDAFVAALDVLEHGGTGE